tara:strand:+ start:240 stop:1802 length:1563 start_codon:yes stop_codon:yes gene_type:complete
LQENSKKFILIHPILLALFPVFLVYSQNIHLILIQGIIFPVLIILGITIALWIGIKFVLKNTRKSALLTSLYVFLFFSYGIVFDVLESNTIQEYFVLIQAFLLIAYTSFVVFGTYYIIKTQRKLNNITSTTNVISITLLAVVFLNIGMYNFQNFTSYEDETNNFILSENNLKNLPDVYYIVLDEYAPLRTLNMFYDYDNADFIEFLQERGFYVTKNSHSNYAETFLAMASTLNMKYVNNLSDIVGKESLDQRIPYQMISNNLVMKNFKSLGYEIYNFDSGWWGTRSLEIADANLCSKNQNMDFHTLHAIKQISVLRAFDMFIKDPSSTFFHQERRDRIFCQFDDITKIKQETEKPIFVFMHIMAPHDPYVFGPNGEEVNYKYTFGPTGNVYLDPNEEKNAYLNQLTYLTKILKQTIENLQENSDNQPVIILQSDTGPSISLVNVTDDSYQAARMSIFNAYFFPNEKYDLLYDDITPVNSFRIVFDSNFQTNYGILEDNVFFSTYEKPYTLIEITDFSIFR